KRVFLVILFTSFSGSLVSRIPGAVQLAGSGSVARWLKVYEERGEAGLRALKIGTKRNIAISVDPEKAASALELSKDRRIEDLERQVRFLETRLMYLKKLKALAHPTKK
ncbi:hypothetical protein G914_03948, partial [Escherichia coli UMEA 3139-1]